VYDGVPLDGVEVRLGEDGRILLGGATIAAGYLDAAELTAETFLEDGGIRWYRTNDLGELDSDGRLVVLGRADDVIITGGVKVSAAHVQAELEKLDGVRAAFVAGVPSAEWGQALAAYVALADSSPEGIRDFTAGAAWAPALGKLAPKTVLAGGELLMLPNGKPDRLGMTVQLTELHQGK
jgi:O-succinylbenzoic acid--CoA ligase